MGRPKKFWDVQKFLGRLKNFWDVQNFVGTSQNRMYSLEPTFQRPHYAQCLSDITAPPNSYDKKRNQKCFGLPKMFFGRPKTLDAQKNILDVQNFVLDAQFLF